jgi:hypothetical protein
VATRARSNTPGIAPGTQTQVELDEDGQKVKSLVTGLVSKEPAGLDHPTQAARNQLLFSGTALVLIAGMFWILTLTVKNKQVRTSLNALLAVILLGTLIDRWDELKPMIFTT